MSYDDDNWFCSDVTESGPERYISVLQRVSVSGKEGWGWTRFATLDDLQDVIAEYRKRSAALRIAETDLRRSENTRDSLKHTVVSVKNTLDMLLGGNFKEG